MCLAIAAATQVRGTRDLDSSQVHTLLGEEQCTQQVQPYTASTTVHSKYNRTQQVQLYTTAMGSIHSNEEGNTLAVFKVCYIEKVTHIPLLVSM